MMVAFVWLPHFGKSAGMLRIDTDLRHLMRVFSFEKQHRLKTKRSIHSMGHLCRIPEPRNCTVLPLGCSGAMSVPGYDAL